MKEEIKKILESCQNRLGQKDLINIKVHEDAITNELLALINKEIGKLEAKVYTYENIIAKSNFKGILDRQDE